MKTEKQQAKEAADFAKRWEGRGYEKGDSQVFWTELLTEVYGVENPSSFIKFEQQAQLDHTSFIDVMIPSTKVMIEQKSLNKDLRTPIKQSDGTMLNPFQQAQRYMMALPVSQHPRWIVTCNFAEFDVYDMENPKGEPQRIYLKDLGREYYRLQFLVETGNEHLQKELEVSMKAGTIVGKLYDAFIREYGDDDPDALRNLNILCVRLVFCLYAEDAGIFGRHDIFHDYMAHYPTEDMRAALLRLFEVLNTPAERRSRYLKADLAAFPYTNGGLFAEEIDIPQFTEEIRDLLLRHASLDFDWSMISPTIFGGVFESTLNPVTRRSGGMHYTSIENIHKVIDPLFLDEFKRELEDIKEEKITKKRNRRLSDFQQKLASLKFFDPACGSGNFLTETYISLRRMENEVIKELFSSRNLDLFDNPIKVNINQFYGIEINDFAVTVATTALWISEAQMLNETERIISQDIDFLPLKSYANIHEGNSLITDWETIVPKDELNYIIGNPPFVGYSYQSKEQKEDLLKVFIDEKGKPFKTAGKIDYVAAWYYKASKIMTGTNIKAALVSTNSITQGEQVAAIWRPLKEMFGCHIDFAHRTFQWDSEANLKAHVHCVIVGFSCGKQPAKKWIFERDQKQEATNINGYLIEAPDVFIDSRKKPLCDVPELYKGSSPVDDGNLLIENEDYESFIGKDPSCLNFIRKFLGAKEFLHNKKRYCIWLQDVAPSEIKKHQNIMERLHAVKEYRLSSTKAATRKYADMPTRFMEIRQPNSDYILIPRHSSENRRYVPMGFFDKDVICGDANIMMPNATLYHFGILESNVHMAWMRAVCGRLKSDYRYSNDIVYNNFPWPNPNEEQRQKIEHTAQAVLDARAKYADSSLADLYDPVLMPPELRKAHQDNDRAVMQAYGFSLKMTESECVAALFEIYAKQTLK